MDAIVSNYPGSLGIFMARENLSVVVLFLEGCEQFFPWEAHLSFHLFLPKTPFNISEEINCNSFSREKGSPSVLAAPRGW